MFNHIYNQVFFAFNALASLNNMYLRAGRVRGVKANFFFYQGGFSSFEWEGTSGMAMNKANLKFKSDRVGTWSGEFNKYLFTFFLIFSIFFVSNEYIILLLLFL